MLFQMDSHGKVGLFDVFSLHSHFHHTPPGCHPSTFYVKVVLHCPMCCALLYCMGRQDQSGSFLVVELRRASQNCGPLFHKESRGISQVSQVAEVDKQNLPG